MSHSSKKRAAFLLVALLLSGFIGYQVSSISGAVPRLFKRNAELKRQGYYMAEFEFKMLGILKLLSDGDYLAAASAFRRLQRQMETGDGLVKSPVNASPGERMDFLLSRQDPVTGAFMDDSYPEFTYLAPTLNVLDALDALSRQTGRPIRLNHRLAFLDSIATPEGLRSYLDGLLYMGEFWAERFPGPGAYGPGVSELAYFDVLERTGVYHFSEKWREAFRTWLDETQDPQTGLWGTRIGSPDAWRQKYDPNSTYHILHFVLTEDGENRDAAHPLLHAKELAQTLVKAAAAPIPEDEDEQHAWNIEQAQATQMLTRLLWKHLLDEDRDLVRKSLATALTERYRLYRRDQGGFSISLASPDADIDGTSSALKFITACGCVPGSLERQRLWGERQASGTASIRIDSLSEIQLPDSPDVNSFRLFASSNPPDDALDDAALAAIVYPMGKGSLPDIMDLRQNLARYLGNDATTLGNWSSPESIRDSFLGTPPSRNVPIFPNGAPDWRAIENRHNTAREFTLAGYDIFQRRISETHYRLPP